MQLKKYETPAEKAMKQRQRMIEMMRMLGNNPDKNPFAGGGSSNQPPSQTVDFDENEVDRYTAGPYDIATPASVMAARSRVRPVQRQYHYSTKKTPQEEQGPLIAPPPARRPSSPTAQPRISLTAGEPSIVTMPDIDKVIERDFGPGGSRAEQPMDFAMGEPEGDSFQGVAVDALAKYEASLERARPAPEPTLDEMFPAPRKRPNPYEGDFI